MVRPKDKHNYTAVSMPKKLFEEAKRIVEQDGRYTGVAEFIRDAMREKIEREWATKKEETT